MMSDEEAVRTAYREWSGGREGGGSGNWRGGEKSTKQVSARGGWESNPPVAGRDHTYDGDASPPRGMVYAEEVKLGEDVDRSVRGRERCAP